MEENSKSFDQDLNEHMSQVRQLNIERMVGILGIKKRSHMYLFEFFNRQILFDHHDFIDVSGKAISSSLKKVFCQYLIRCPNDFLKESKRLVTFREFPESGPLFSRFTENTNKTIECAFSGQLHRHRNEYCPL